MNKYLSWVSDDNLLQCIENLHDAYIKASEEIDRAKLSSNKVDIIKFIFDISFNNLTIEQKIDAEVARQIDKSITNAIGTFHEELLGSITGYEKNTGSGYDIKANDNTLFADIKNKHNTMNAGATEALYQKLQRYAEEYEESKCYWVQILATKSFEEHWELKCDKGKREERVYNHPNLYKISGDQFYAKLSGIKDAFYQLYAILPTAIKDFLNSKDQISVSSTALTELKKISDDQSKSIMDLIAFENFPYYSGFDKL